MVERTSRVYRQAYEAITGKEFRPDISGDTVLDRIRANLARYF
jgi:phosphoribosylaminoimidazole-succinocarboxamide synthase